jgi:phosphatidate cytidylyltransferase
MMVQSLDSTVTHHEANPMNFVVTQGVNSSLVWVTLAAIGALTAGTAIRLSALRGAAVDEAKKRKDSLRSWWIITLAVCMATLLGSAGVCTLMAVVSLLAFRELLQLVPLRRANRWAIVSCSCLIVAHYGLTFVGSDGVNAFLPLGLLIVTGTILMFSGESKGFLHSASTICWGLLLTTYTLSHAAMLTTGAFATSRVGATGFFLFVVVVTELNDIAQALVGRRIGKRKITPRLSPHKTWEGFLGGIAVTSVAAVLLGHWLLPLVTPWLTSLLLGLAICVSGFLGDIHMSAMKRDLGVKDSGTILPGQGGILDRIDSLTFSAPVFFYLASWTFHHV